MNVTHESVIPFARAAVWQWHQRPGAMQRLLPPWQPLKVKKEASSLRDATAMLQLPAGLMWRAQHVASDFEPQRRFTDELRTNGTGQQILRPIRWCHEHLFEEAGDRKTRIIDRIDTNLPETQVRRILAYRHEQLSADLSVHQRAAEHGLEPLTIAVSGSHGMVGTALCAFLETGGHRVIRLVRGTAQGTGERRWDPESPAPDLFSGCDAVIHLAGASIFGRFTAAHRQKIRNSRIEPTRQLARRAAASGVKVFISASAIGIYGADSGPSPLDELGPVGEDFLARVVRDWEDAAASGADGAMRRVQIRTGLVQSPTGGVLRVLKPLYEAGLGGKLGSGRQWQSWIGLDDLVDIYHRALWDSALDGPVNAVAPHPVQNAEYSRILASVLHRPDLLPIPALGPKVLLGSQGAHLLALASQRVEPAKLQEAGHQFRASSLEPALRHSLGRVRA